MTSLSQCLVRLTFLFTSSAGIRKISTIAKDEPFCEIGCEACGSNWYKLRYNNGTPTESWKNAECECCKGTTEQIEVCKGACSQLEDPVCGSCKDLDDWLFWEAWGLTYIGASDTTFGDAHGSCCHIRHMFSDRPTELASASKMVAVQVILKIVDEGFLTLDTKAADVFDFWTADDHRKNVTLRHLLSLTAGLTTFRWGPGFCFNRSSTRDCAKEAYETSFKSGAEPGTEFEYVETSWYIASAMAMEVINASVWDDVFQFYIAKPLGIDSRRCGFTLPARSWAYAGSGLVCGTPELGKIMRMILSKSLFKNTTLLDEAERPHTLNVRRSAQHQAFANGKFSCPPGTQELGCNNDIMPEWGQDNITALIKWHYGLGQWTECATTDCEGGVVRTSSPGLMGTYPWVDRGGISGNRPHWGIIVRFWKSRGEGVRKIQEELFPRVASTFPYVQEE